MFLKAALLIILGVICLILTLVALIFGIIGFANNKPNKYVWLTTFFCGLIGMIICIFMFVQKVVNRVQDFTQNTLEQFQNFGDSLSHNETIDTHVANHNSPQIKLLKNYLPKSFSGNESEEFYTYLGFKDYYRYPLRYPYSIHCMYDQNNGELYNESNVNRFDENDNGEVYAGLSEINKIAFDQNYLLVEQNVSSTRTDKTINHYILYDLTTEKEEETTSLTKLLQLAKSKGYTGPDDLISLEEYGRLFQ